MKKQQPTQDVKIDLDIKNIVPLLCPDCLDKVRTAIETRVEQQVLSGMLKNMVDQVMGEVMPRNTGEDAQSGCPKRLLTAKRNLPAVRNLRTAREKTSNTGAAS